MSNRETFPASQSPLTGDISGPAGATSVTVVGIQNIPVEHLGPTDQMNLTYNAVTQQWEPALPGNISVILNGTADSLGVLTGFTIISDDYDVLVNHVGLEVLVGWPYGFGFNVYVNGTGVA
jgi:hypothetical protein